MERRLAAILAADVVGYTALMGADEAGTLRRMTELRQEILEPLIAEHHGRVVKLMGDGLLVEFASVVDSIACAVAWQERVAEHEAEGDEDKRLQFRIGINLGDVIVEGDDIHGDGVNIAARLGPGQICNLADADPSPAAPSADGLERGVSTSDNVTDRLLPLGGVSGR